jgi:hypothetical protein
MNLYILFAEAKAENTIVAEGWNTLNASVTNISRQMRERLEVPKFFSGTSIVQLFYYYL